MLSSSVRVDDSVKIKNSVILNNTAVETQILQLNISVSRCNHILLYIRHIL